MVQNVFRSYNSEIELQDIDEPFFYVERAMDTHWPYGKISHGNEMPEDSEQEGSLPERYQKGIKSTEEHFWRHVRELKDRGIFDETLVVFTSDHGELLEEEHFGLQWDGHNKPMVRDLVVVPTVFLNAELSSKRARTIDIVPTALSMTDRDLIGDGIDLNEREPDSGYTMLQVQTKPLVTTGCTWNWEKEEWKRVKGGFRSDLASIGLRFIEPVRQRLRGKLGSGDEEKSPEESVVDDISV